MLSPKKLRYRKPHRPDVYNGVAHRGNYISFGTYAIQAQSNGWVSARQIESARRAMTRHIKRGGQVWIRVFPDRAITEHGNESSMGGGKGAPDHFVAAIKSGKILFEMGGVPEELAKEAMRLASHKLSVKTKFLTRE